MEAENKRKVQEFYEKGLNQKDGDAAICYLGARYTQHNPNADDGPEGFRKFIDFLKEKFPQSRNEIKRVFAEGNYVILHVHAVREPGTRGNAIVDIFKLEEGKIVEHSKRENHLKSRLMNAGTVSLRAQSRCNSHSNCGMLVSWAPACSTRRRPIRWASARQTYYGRLR